MNRGAGSYTAKDRGGEVGGWDIKSAAPTGAQKYKRSKGIICSWTDRKEVNVTRGGQGGGEI